ncbi:MAG: DUF333 domain-containing protein [Patescibacteria group bacterium]
MKKLFLLVSLVFLGAGCGANMPANQNINSAPATNEQVGIANPASVNCEEKGGILKIEKRGGGGEFGVCYFEDNRQCEEWALFRDECPVGGRKVTGYITEAARYCAITGGEYIITDETASPEEGNCKLPGGTVCDAWDFYNGKCSKN